MRENLSIWPAFDGAMIGGSVEEVEEVAGSDLWWWMSVDGGFTAAPAVADWALLRAVMAEALSPSLSFSLSPRSWVSLGLFLVLRCSRQLHLSTWDVACHVVAPLFWCGRLKAIHCANIYLIWSLEGKGRFVQFLRLRLTHPLYFKLIYWIRF